MPALDARRVKLTIFFPIDEPLSIDDALSGSSSNSARSEDFASTRCAGVKIWV